MSQFKSPSVRVQVELVKLDKKVTYQFVNCCGNYCDFLMKENERESERESNKCMRCDESGSPALKI